MALNLIKRYYFWISLNDIFFNFIEWYKYEFYKNNLYKMYPRLISSLSFDNKSLMISMFSFSTAKYSAVWLRYIILKFHWKL